MSLHRKIIGWFVVFAGLTITAFGLLDYVQSERSLRFGVETRVGALAQQLAAAVELTHERAESELLLIGHAAAAGDGDALPPTRQGYADVRLRREGVVIFEAAKVGQSGAVATGCATGDVRFDVRFADAAGARYRIEARLPVAEFLGDVAPLRTRLGRRGVTALARTADGALVFDPACAITSDATAAALADSLAARVAAQAAADVGAVTLTELQQTAADERVLATVRLGGPAWTAVAGMDYAEFAAPFMRLRWEYFGVTAAVLLLALAVVLRGIRRDMRRLAAIAQAADAIGHGHFDVWLPPPTGDEIGRVSLALGSMTERLASSLRQAELSRSMAAVGELATYLSHEIRNPLSSIRLNLQMLGRDLRGGTVPDDGAQLVGLCLSELHRLDDVVRTVLEVGRSGPRATGSCSPAVVVEQTLRVMKRKFFERGVKVDVALDAPDAHVATDSGSLRGIVMNLVLNSVEALDGRPDPRITVSGRLLDEGGAHARFELRVADNGPGVPPHLRARIFDPFFTTKATGNGIGLPTALRTVQQCGGMLRYEPAADWGGGAEFVLELPLAGQAEMGDGADKVILATAGVR